MSEKYSGYNEDDTKYDAYHKATGQMTNREFFSSNAKGGFYEGMEYDEDTKEWVPDAESRQRAYDAKKQNECNDCGEDKRHCFC